MSRPEAQIDWKLVDKLLEGGADGVQVAAHLGIHPNTLYRHCEDQFKISFSAYLQEKKSKGDALLHMAQFNKAIKGDSQMLKHLGEFRLGQKSNNKEGLEDIITRLLDAIREGEARITSSANSGETIQPPMADQQPLLDKESAGTTD